MAKNGNDGSRPPSALSDVSSGSTGIPSRPSTGMSAVTVNSRPDSRDSLSTLLAEQTVRGLTSSFTGTPSAPRGSSSTRVSSTGATRGPGSSGALINAGNITATGHRRGSDAERRAFTQQVLKKHEADQLDEAMRRNGDLREGRRRSSANLAETLLPERRGSLGAALLPRVNSVNKN